MKKNQLLGKMLTKSQQQKIFGGNVEEDSLDSCGVVIKCNDTCYARPNCPTTCTHTQTHVTCGSVTYTNSSVCNQAGC